MYSSLLCLWKQYRCPSRAALDNGIWACCPGAEFENISRFLKFKELSNKAFTKKGRKVVKSLQPSMFEYDIYIKKTRHLQRCNKGESDQSFWMMSYDFKTYKKEDYKPDSLMLRKKRRYKNKLIIILYIIVIFLFILLVSFLSHVLILIS